MLLWLNPSSSCWIQNSLLSELISVPLCSNPALQLLAYLFVSPIFLFITASTAFTPSQTSLKIYLKTPSPQVSLSLSAQPIVQNSFTDPELCGCFTHFYPLPSGTQWVHRKCLLNNHTLGTPNVRIIFLGISFKIWKRQLTQNLRMYFSSYTI